MLKTKLNARLEQTPIRFADSRLGIGPLVRIVEPEDQVPVQVVIRPDGEIVQTTSSEDAIVQVGIIEASEEDERLGSRRTDGQSIDGIVTQNGTFHHPASFHISALPAKGGVWVSLNPHLHVFRLNEKRSVLRECFYVPLPLPADMIHREGEQRRGGEGRISFAF